ncbi:unnamed protein product [Blepharisma stoltei]|uniref:Uncharacterized protein n=1 Tax=Blepharisma stoltei TaxID=1481888 RepID=A0AAU9J704_9CILI|nr:unnamed protein product [Blepharisma stoltei]
MVSWPWRLLQFSNIKMNPSPKAFKFNMDNVSSYSFSNIRNKRPLTKTPRSRKKVNNPRSSFESSQRKSGINVDFISKFKQLLRTVRCDEDHKSTKTLIKSAKAIKPAQLYEKSPKITSPTLSPVICYSENFNQLYKKKFNFSKNGWEYWRNSSIRKSPKINQKIILEKSIEKNYFDSSVKNLQKILDTRKRRYKFFTDSEESIERSRKKILDLRVDPGVSSESSLDFAKKSHLSNINSENFKEISFKKASSQGKICKNQKINDKMSRSSLSPTCIGAESESFNRAPLARSQTYNPSTRIKLKRRSPEKQEKSLEEFGAWEISY